MRELYFLFEPPPNFLISSRNQGPRFAENPFNNERILPKNSFERALSLSKEKIGKEVYLKCKWEERKHQRRQRRKGGKEDIILRGNAFRPKI